LTKAEIRTISQTLGLPTWNKQSFACLSSRFPYGESITSERLRQIDLAEQLLLDMGMHQVRVRYHAARNGKPIARIETDENGYRVLSDRENRERIYRAFREFGFQYTAVDLLGYRTGSMNEGAV
jgi:uncharacterized protein